MKGRHIHIVCLALLLFIPYLAFAQGTVTQITYQYWLDDNTGAATTAQGNDAGDGLDINLDLDVGETGLNLSPGVHFYNIRAAVAGQWGTVQRFIFSIPAIPDDVPPSLIVKYIYWLDDDYEHRVETPVGEHDEEFTTTTIPAIASFDVSSLSPGVHYYNVRILDSNDKYSTTQRYIFSIPAASSGTEPADLQLYEYWIDNDYANRKSKQITDDEYTTDGTFASIDMTGLDPGVHFYNMRAQDENGIWGAPQRFIFSIPAASSGTEPADLQLYEYWIDNDYANRKSKQITDDEYTTDGTFASIDMTGLDPGVHFYNMRAQDADGIWGTPQRYIFSIPAPQQQEEEKQIKGYLYSFNNETPNSVMFASPVDEFEQEISFSTPSPGPLIVIDDSCKFEFNATYGTVKMRRYNPMSFTLMFMDERNTHSVPIVEEFVVVDSLSKDVELITSPGTYQVSTHEEGGFDAYSFVVGTETKLALRANDYCGLRLYNSEGELLNAYDSQTIKLGVSNTFAPGTYYAIVFENTNAIKLALYPGDEEGMNALRPTISYNEETQIVTISGTIDGASYYYTIDGTYPTIESTLYTEPFMVTNNATIKAIAAWGDMVVSNSRSYVVSTIKGDTNGDGTIDIADVTAIINFILGNPSDTFAENLADMNGDNVVDIFDAMLLLNYIINYIPTTPSGARKVSGHDEITGEQIMLAAEQENIYIGIDQAERFTSFQFDLTLPAGTELSDVSLVSDANTHRLMFAHSGANNYRVVGYSLSNDLFTSIGDKLIELHLSGAAEGDVSVGNILFVTPNEQKVWMAGKSYSYTTQIDGVEMNAEAKDIYKLNGQKLGNSRKQLDKGVYIINHKKVIIK